MKKKRVSQRTLNRMVAQHNAYVEQQAKYRNGYPFPHDYKNIKPVSFKNIDASGLTIGKSTAFRTNLLDADFEGANLEGATFTYCFFNNSDFCGANLYGATFIDCHLFRSWFMNSDMTNVTVENSEFRHCNFFGAVTHGLFARIRGHAATFARSVGLVYNPTGADRLLERIASIVVNAPESLRMKEWHSTCGTKHCLAGWAVHLSPEAERIEMQTNTEIAGLLTLGSEAHAIFFPAGDEDDTALGYLRSIHQSANRRRNMARLERLKSKSRFIADSLEKWYPENLDGTLTTAYFAVKFSLFNKRGNAWLDYTILRSWAPYSHSLDGTCDDKYLIDSPHSIRCEYKSGKSDRARSKTKLFISTFEFEKAILRLERAARRQNRHKTAVQAYI